MQKIETGLERLSVAASNVVIFKSDPDEVRQQKSGGGYFILAAEQRDPDRVVERVRGWNEKCAKRLLGSFTFFEELLILVASRAHVLSELDITPEEVQTSLFTSSDILLRSARVSIMGNRILYGSNGQMPEGVARAIAANERRIEALRSFQTTLLPAQPSTL